MTTECRVLDETTFADAAGLVRDRFGDGAVSQLQMILRNPLRRLCPDAGNIGYRDGRAVCMQSAMLRRLYFGKDELFGTVGGMTCKVKKGCPLSLLLKTIETSQAYRHEGKIGFGNSCIKATAELNAGNGSPVGPESCTRHLWRAIRPLECVAYFVRRKVFKGGLPTWRDFSTLESVGWNWTSGVAKIVRTGRIERSFFDELMRRYLSRNEGLVCSRTADEVEWTFGEKVARGTAVLLTAFMDDAPAGYIVLDSNRVAKRWVIHDWFAVDNSPVVLDRLLNAACRFLRKKTPAMMLEAEGFPTFIQPVLKKYLPHVRPVGHNQFSWGSCDMRFKAQVMPIIDSPKSWFFGPYDGDECMSS